MSSTQTSNGKTIIITSTWASVVLAPDSWTIKPQSPPTRLCLLSHHLQPQPRCKQSRGRLSESRLPHCGYHSRPWDLFGQECLHMHPRARRQHPRCFRLPLSLLLLQQRPSCPIDHLRMVSPPYQQHCHCQLPQVRSCLINYTHTCGDLLTNSLVFICHVVSNSLNIGLPGSAKYVVGRELPAD